MQKKQWSQGQPTVRSIYHTLYGELREGWSSPWADGNEAKAGMCLGDRKAFYCLDKKNENNSVHPKTLIWGAAGLVVLSGNWSPSLQFFFFFILKLGYGDGPENSMFALQMWRPGFRVLEPTPRQAQWTSALLVLGRYRQGSLASWLAGLAGTSELPAW